MKVVCLDLSHIFRMQWEVTKGKPSEDPVKRAFDYIAERRDGFDVAVIACDAIVDDPATGLRSATSFRTKIDPPRPDPDDASKRIGYKANRESPGAAFYEQQRRLTRMLRADGCHVFTGPEVEPGLFAEADDVMGWVAALYRVAAEQALVCDANPDDWKLQIVSGDMDMFALIDPMVDITVLSPQGGKVYDDEAVLAHQKLGVMPAKIPQLKALAGDKSDEFFPFQGPRLASGRRSPGIGTEIAKGLLAAYGDARSAVLAALNDPPPADMKPNVVTLLRAGGIKAVEKGLALATLKTDLALDFTPVLEGPASLRPDDVATPRYTPAPVKQEPVAAAPAVSAPVQEAPAAAMIVDSPRPAQGLVKAPVAPEMAPLGGISPYQFQPREFGELETASRVAFASGCYAQFAKYEQVMMCILEAAERGIPMGVALRNAYVVKGKLSWSASIIIGQVRRSGLARIFRIVETERDYAVLEYQHINDAKPSLFKFTLEEANKAGWCRSGEKGDSKWITNPRTMCRWAAMREVARFAFPEVTSGMHTPDELLRGAVTDADIGDDPEGV